MKNYLLPLRELVLQPGLTVPLYMDNTTSLAALDKAAKEHSEIILVSQKNYSYPQKPDELADCGTRANVLQMLRLPDGTFHVLLHTTAAVKLSNKIVGDDGVFTSDVADIEFNDDTGDYTTALRDKVADGLRVIARSKRINMEKLKFVINSYSIGAFIDAVIHMTDIDVDTANKILVMNSYSDQLKALLEQIAIMTEMTKIDDAISKRVTSQMEQGRREAYLQEKMRALQREMGEDSEDMDSENLKKRIQNSNMPAEAKEKAMTEWKRMKNLNVMSNEGAMLRTYLDELLSMPWGISDKSEIDLKSARETLDLEHSGMNGVKERILEHIAVMKKTGQVSGSILCLVGAPGVGKTSLGRSVAAALGRKYQRISLGGISDEAHFRGHRKTYIGSQPGRIMDALKRCGADNPVIVLDEIDKMGRDHRGDPESALLEVLDPEQNKTFRDHYLECDFDLSKVLFIATANTLNISQALKDRMEIIEIPGYTEEEKIEIAKKHLIARSAAATGWAVENINISDDAIRHVIRNYTAEQGVRELQRELTALLRRSLLENDGADKKTEFTAEKIDSLLKVRTIGMGRKKIGFNSGLRV